MLDIEDGRMDFARPFLLLQGLYPDSGLVAPDKLLPPPSAYFYEFDSKRFFFLFFFNIRPFLFLPVLCYI